MDALDQKKSDSAHILPKENLTAHQETEKQQDLLDKDAQKITTCSVPSEASAFLGAVGAFLVLLVIFYLYLSKKLCFTTIGGFPCCDKPLNDHREPVSKDLGSAEHCLRHCRGEIENVHKKMEEAEDRFRERLVSSRKELMTLKSA
ncbi:unnamed protein product [Larinioides sclopetarius]|uniref:Uncharacterized protein n=1 Tax=Larinioides sclopetarius TaxID=280406 RepID=A0AAV1ZFB1_9ARAC